MTSIPTHLGFIVDGNRRWAKQGGLPTLEGHRRGLTQVEIIAEECFNRGIKFVTFFLFSTENWNRATEEVGYLMDLARTEIKRLTKKLIKNNIKLAFLGSHARVAPDLLESLAASEAAVAHCTGGTLGICFNYGGRQEIIDAANAAFKAKTPKLDQESLAAYLYHPEIPDLDLLVRTSGEQRISGFMLWRAAYAELLFIEKYWPDITTEDIDDILKIYASRQRRFGK